MLIKSRIQRPCVPIIFQDVEPISLEYNPRQYETWYPMPLDFDPVSPWFRTFQYHYTIGTWYLDHERPWSVEQCTCSVDLWLLIRQKWGDPTFFNGRFKFSGRKTDVGNIKVLVIEFVLLAVPFIHNDFNTLCQVLFDIQHCHFYQLTIQGVLLLVSSRMTGCLNSNSPSTRSLTWPRKTEFSKKFPV